MASFRFHELGNVYAVACGTLKRAGPEAPPPGTLVDALACQIDECNPQHIQRGYR